MTTTAALPVTYLVTFPNGHTVPMNGEACRAHRDTTATRGVKIDDLPYGGFAFQPHGGEGLTRYEPIDNLGEYVRPTSHLYVQHIHDDSEWTNTGTVNRAKVARTIGSQASRYARTIVGLVDGTIVILVDRRQYVRFTPREA